MKKLKKIISVLLISPMIINNTQNLSVYANEAITKNKVEKSVKVADIKPPTIDIDTLKVDKSEVKPGDTVKVSIKANDDISGISYFSIGYMTPITKKSIEIRMKYNNQTDRYEGNLYIDESKEEGLWKIDYVYLEDEERNSIWIYNSNIYDSGYLKDLSAGNFKVGQTNSDINPPTIDVDTLKVDKSEVKPGDTVKVSIKANDDISGISYFSIGYMTPITKKSIEIRMKYNNQTDRYEGNLYIDESKEEGLWKIDYVYLEDEERNSIWIYNSNIYDSGYLKDLSAGNFKVSNDNNVINPIEFHDINSHWAKDTIKSFISKGYINGYQDGSFKPNNDIMRAEFVKIVNRVFGFTEKGTVTFNDVKSSDWFYNDIAIAQKAGYINGKTLTTFAPNDKITRQEVAVILTNIMNNKDTVYDRINTFTDGYKTSSWAKSSVEGAIEAGYLRGNDKGLLNPTGNITRAEAVTMLSRVKK